MVWSYLRRPARRIPGLRLEAVLLPARLPRDDRIVGAFEDDFITLLRHASEGAVSIHQMKWVVAVVHELVLRDQIQHGLDAEQDDGNRDHDHQAFEDEGAWDHRRNREWHDRRENRISEGAETEHSGEPVQPRIVAADDQP